MIVHPECESKLTLGCNEPNNNATNAKLTPGKQNLENFLLDKKASPKIPPQIYLTVHSGGFLDSSFFLIWYKNTKTVIS